MNNTKYVFLMILCVSFGMSVEAARRGRWQTTVSEEEEQIERRKRQKLETTGRVDLRQKLIGLTPPEPNVAVQNALSRADEIRQVVDQTENPETIFMQHSDCIPLPPVLLNIIKEYLQEM